MNRAVIFLSVAVAITGCSGKKSQVVETLPAPVTQVTGIGKIIPESGISEVASPVSGIVIGLPVSEGSHVKKGDVLVMLDNTGETLAVRESDSRIATQQKAVESQQWLIEQKKTDIADKLRKLTDAQELLKSNATSGENVRKLQNDLDMANQEMKKLESDLALQQSQLKEAYARQAISMNNLEQTSLKAPVDGVVLDILPNPGEAVSQFQTYARLAPDNRLIVNAEFDEMFAAKLAIGQRCEVHVPGDSVQIANGKIVRLSADLKKKSLFSDSGDDLEDRRVREAEVLLDSISGELLINTKVECTVQVN
ncbi:MAG TPA: HlyD family efflux transporter periplasmic adaptor subunit [Bacteroidales bacterium]|nr:HlyD family efflux transporter periplasmic adaptor subunit [Bacteroidales bacterium]